jgi:hypothetical protein
MADPTRWQILDAAGQVLAELSAGPGLTIRPTAVAEPTPTPPPPPPPPVDQQAGTVRVAAGGDLAAALRSLADGGTLALERGGSWPGVLPWRWSGARLTSYGDPSAALPVLGGLELAAGVHDCFFDRFALQPAAPWTGYGVRGVAGGLARLVFEELLVAGFCDNVALHDPLLDAAGATLLDVTFRRCRILDARPADPFADGMATRGQGIFAANVNGLTLEGNLIAGNGWPDRPNIFRHGVYVRATCRRVKATGNLVADNASYGLQLRAPGSWAEGNLFAGNGLACLINGESGVFQDNAVQLGRWNVSPDKALWYGKGGLAAHVGSGSIARNLFVDGPMVMPAGYHRVETLLVGPRPKKEGWEWDQPCRPAVGENVDRTADVRVDLADLVAEARRPGTSIEAARQRAFERCRAAVG